MPHDFRFPTRETLFWTPYRFKEENYQDRNDNLLEGFGRLKPGVSLAQAQGELLLIAARLRRQYPKENESVDLSVVGVRDELTTESRPLLKGLCGAALCVLVIACANLANLLLARSLARQRELSIRLSLGASRRNLLRQLLSESLLLGLAGGASATAVAIAALPLLARLVPNALPIQQVPPVDTQTLLFALGLTLITVIGFGVAPALQGMQGCGFEWASRGRAHRRNGQSPGKICAGDCGTRSIRRAAGFVRVVDSRFVEGAIRRPRFQNQRHPVRCVRNCPSPNTTKPALAISSIAKC